MANIDCFAKDIVEKYSLDQYFDHIFLSCDTGMLKTDKAFFPMIIEKLGMAADDLVMVGDSMESDIRSAQTAGIKCVLVDRNNRMSYENRISNLSGLKDYL